MLFDTSIYKYDDDENCSTILAHCDREDVNVFVGGENAAAHSRKFGQFIFPRGRDHDQRIHYRKRMKTT